MLCSLVRGRMAPVPATTYTAVVAEERGETVASGVRLPQGLVAFLFTDIEGSTRLAAHLGHAYPEILGAHNAIVRRGLKANGGVEVKTVGDAFFAAFSEASQALAAACDMQRDLRVQPWPPGASVRVRMGIHVGEAVAIAGDYVGLAVHRAARVCHAAHGGQVLLSAAAASAAADGVLTAHGVRLLDLGPHLLKDFDDAEHLRQVVQTSAPEYFPPPRSLSAPRHNLPRQRTTFVGRHEELHAVRALLSGNRLVTLIGPGGVGKTRLATEVAEAQIESFPDGVWLVSLAPLSSGDLVADAVAAVTGVAEQAGRSRLEGLISTLRERHLLVVLDNCEHVRESCADLADALLDACAGVQLLATCREPLGVTGELVWRIPPLGIPPARTDAGRLATHDAARLLLDRATLGGARFELTAHAADAVISICRRLDGLPLALELAAARIRTLGVERMAEDISRRLRLLSVGTHRSDPRHRTLRAVVDWSFELLNSREQALLRRLSVFAGAFSIEDAIAVCADDELAADDVADMMAALIDKSMVASEAQSESVRLRLLEMIRAYAHERLSESGELRGVLERHLAWCARIGAAGAAGLDGPEQPQSMARLSDVLDDLRAAVDWAADEGNPEEGLRALAGLWRFWYLRGGMAEGQRRTTRALASAPDAPDRLRARALLTVATLGALCGDMHGSAAHFEEALIRAEEAGDERLVARASSGLGLAFTYLGKPDLAEPMLSRALQLDAAGAPIHVVARSRMNLGVATYEQGRFAEAETIFAEALTEARAGGDQILGTLLLVNLGGSRLRLGRIDDARADFDESLSAAEALGSPSLTALNRRGLAECDLAAGVRGAGTHLAEAIGVQWASREWAQLIDTMDAAAQLAASVGRPADAARLLAFGEAVREREGMAHLVGSDALTADLRRAARGDAQAWSYGHRLSDEAAIDLALDLCSSGGTTASGIQKGPQ